MHSEIDRHLDCLRARFGRTWQIWVIYPALGGTIWCARKHADHQYVVNEDDPAALELRLASEAPED
jgi:hypothetical protein